MSMVGLQVIFAAKVNVIRFYHYLLKVLQNAFFIGIMTIGVLYGGLAYTIIM